MKLSACFSPAKSAVCALAVTVLTLAVAGTAHAASTFTVNTTADNPPAVGECSGVAGDCSIRQALAESATGDTILVPPGHYLLVAQLSVGHGVTIKGTPSDSPATTILDGQGKTRVFAIDADLTPPTTIEGLTITNGIGTSGGGISNESPVVLVNDAVTHNTATDFGGGIASTPATPSPARTHSAPTFSSEALTISSTLIADNKVLANPPPKAPTNTPTTSFGIGGGGIASESGGVSLTNSTVVDNTVDTNGNSFTAGGGGIAAGLESTVETLNVTVNNNSVTGGTGSSGGGIASGFARAAPQNGQVPSASFTAQNTIVSRDHITIGGTTSVNDCADLTTISDANISTDASCGFTDAASRQGTDPGYTSASPQDNGGLTSTLGINEASPAFNTADDTGCPGTDQRGITRPQAGICDIGAFEYVPSADLQITKTGSPLSVTVGQNIAYTLIVRNNGPDPASGVTVADTLPASETLVSAVPSQGTCTTLTCALGNLSSGATATITIVAHTTASGALTNKATVRGDQNDPNISNNTAAATNAVAAAPAQKISRPTVHVAVAHCYRRAVSLAVRISSKAALKGVRVLLRGHLILTTKKKHFTIHIAKLNTTRRVLTIVARNGAGKSHAKHVTLRRCPTPKPRFTG